MNVNKKIEAIAIAAIIAISVFLGIMLAVADTTVTLKGDDSEGNVVPDQTYTSHVINITDAVAGANQTNVTWFNVSWYGTNSTIELDDIKNVSIVNESDPTDIFGFDNVATNISRGWVNISNLTNPAQGYIVNDTTVNFSVNITINITGLIDGRDLAPNVTVGTFCHNTSDPDNSTGAQTGYVNDTAAETIEVLNTTTGTSNTTALVGEKNVLCANVIITPGNNSVNNYLKAITFNTTAATTIGAPSIENFSLWNDTNANNAFNSAADTLINSTNATDVNVTFDLTDLLLADRTIPAAGGTFFLTMNISGSANIDDKYQATIFAQNITINQTVGEGNTGNSSATEFTTLTIVELTPTPTPAPVVRRGGGRAAPSLGPGETTVSTEPTGEVTSAVTAPSADGKAVVTIYEETIAKDAAGSPLTSVTVTPPSALPAGAPSGANYVGYAYDFGPEGATFSKPVTISITFDTAKYEGKTPVIHVYEAGAWKALATTVVGNRATATVTHFSTFVLFAAEEVITPTPTATPTPKPTPTATPSPTPTPTPEGPGFEAVFAIAGLLAVAYLVLRRKKRK